MPTAATPAPISGPGADPGPVKETTTTAVRNESESESERTEMSAREKAQKRLLQGTIRFGSFIAKYAITMFLVFLTAVTGTLLHVDFWPSWFWMIPVVIFVTPIISDLFVNVRTKRKEKFGTIVKRRIQSLVVAVVVLVLLLLFIASNLVLVAWGLIGNESLGSPGIVGWGMNVSAFFLGGPLAFIAVVLAIAVPSVLLVRLTKAAARDDIVLWKVLLFAVLTSLAFTLPMSWSIVLSTNM